MRTILDRAWTTMLTGWSGGQLTGPAVISVGIVGCGAALGYLSQVMVSRSIGPEQFGIFSYVTGLLLIGRTVVSLSLDFAALRFVSIYFASDNWALVKGFVRASRRITALTALLGTLVCAVVIVALSDRLPAHMPSALLAGCLALVPLTLLSLEVAFLQAIRRVYAPRIPFNIIRPLVLIGGLLAAIHVFGQAGTAVVAIYANLLATILTLVITYMQMQSHIPSHLPAEAPAREKKQWLSFCGVNLGQNIVYLILSQQADIVVVGSLVGTTDAGYYSAASQIASIIMLGVGAANQYVAPMLAEHEVSRNSERLPGLIWRVLLLNAALSLPLIAAVIVLGPFLLGLFGPSFVAAYPVIAILALGCLVNGLWASLWGDLLTMTGLYREATVIVIAVSVLNLILTFILTPRYGITGAAWATTSAVVVRSALVAIVVNSKFGFWPWTVWRKAKLA